MSTTVVNRTDSFEQWRVKTNTVSSDVGDRSALSVNITNNTSLVLAVNELQGDIGVVGSLSTTDKTSLVNAVNELKTGSSVVFSGTKSFSGAISFGSTIGVTGTSSLAALTATTGSFSSTLAATGDFAIATNKFTVAAASGNTLVAGTLGVTGVSSLASVNLTTVTAGTWNGTLIGSTYGGTGVNNAGRTLTIATDNISLTAQSGGSVVTLPASGTLATLAGTETLSGKSISLTSNTVTGTIAQFNTALSDADFATLAGSETLTNKTLIDATTIFQDETTSTKKFQFQASGITAGNTRTLTIPDSSGTIALTTDLGYAGNVRVGVSTAQTISTSTGNLILDSAGGTTTVNDVLAVTVAVSSGSPSTAVSLTNSSHASPSRFTIDSNGNVAIAGDLSVSGNTTITSATFSPAWTSITGKNSWYTFSDGTNTSVPEAASGTSEGDTFKFRGANGVTVTVTNDDSTHGDNLLIGLSSVPNASLANSSVTVTAGTGLSGGGAVSLGSSVTLTNAGVTSIVAGSGISISGGTGAVTITNSATGANAFGNIAVSGQTTVAAATTNATLTLVGSGVTITTDNSTKTVTLTGANTFSTIAISGQSNVVADSASDTLTLVAGSNISLTTDALTDSITISGSASANNATITLSAGTGLSGGGTFTTDQSTPGTITFTNAGVTSAVAGSGIGVSGATGAVTFTNSDRGSSQNIFKTIAVSGQTSIAAASNTETLTVAAAQVSSTTGIVITTDNSTKTLTLSHADTSSATSTSNTGGNVVQTVTVDTYGHVTALASTDLDTRYLKPSTAISVTSVTTTGDGSIGGNLGVTGNITVTGNLTINGTTTTVNATTVTLDDPVLTLGGDTTPSVDDNKDRGIEFRWHNGTSAKVGFFGFDDSTGYLAFYPDATNTSEVFSGSLGDIQAANFRGALIGNASTATSATTAGSVTNGVYTTDTGTVTNTMLAGSIANAKLSNSTISIAGTSTALGASITLDTITGLSSTGLVKRTGLNTLAIATSGTDYAPATSGSSLLYGNGSGGFSNATVGSGLSFTAGTLSLGLSTLTIGSYLTGTSYNGTSAVTIAVDASTAATASKIVARDAGGVIQASALALNTGTSGIANGELRCTAITGTGGASVATLTTTTTATIGSSATVATALTVGSTALGSTGDIRATGNVTAYYSSDRRIKENIATIPNALEKMDSINGVTFDWTDEFINDHGGLDDFFMKKNTVGVIAQEIETVLPEAVATRQDGIKAVRYELIVPLLIQAIKELKSEVAALKSAAK